MEMGFVSCQDMSSDLETDSSEQKKMAYYIVITPFESGQLLNLAIPHAYAYVCSDTSNW